MIPPLGLAFQLAAWTQLVRPSTFFAFLAAFLTFQCLALFRLESKPVEVEVEASG